VFVHKNVVRSLMRLEPNLLEIIPQQNTAIVDWSMGTTCNYSCSYCPTMLHDGAIAWPDEQLWTTVLDTCDQHFDRPIQYVLSGGEPTVMPQFEKFITAIKNKRPGNLISIITNGSRTVNWWKKNKHLIDTVNMSVHIEQCDPNHILDVALEYHNPGVNELNVLIPIAPDTWDKSIAAAELLASNANGYAVSLKRLRKNFGSESYEYSPEQEYILQQYSLFNTYDESWVYPLPKPDRIAVNHTLVTTEGSVSLNANKLINENNNVFTGMKCYIGIDKIFINVWREITAGSWCPQGTHFNIIGFLDRIDEIRWPTDPIVCEQPRCMNATDMRTRKHR